MSTTSTDSNPVLNQSTEAELSETLARTQDRPHDQIVKALLPVFRNKHIPWLSQFMHATLVNHKRITDQHWTQVQRDAILEALRVIIIDRYVTTVEKIKEAMLECSLRLPSNTYNVQDALNSFAYRLDPFEPKTLLLATSLLPGHIMSTGGRAIYTEADLEYAHQTGFEAGYEKALETSHDEDISERIACINLPEN